VIQTRIKDTTSSEGKSSTSGQKTTYYEKEKKRGQDSSEKRKEFTSSWIRPFLRVGEKLSRMTCREMKSAAILKKERGRIC